MVWLIFIGSTVVIVLAAVKLAEYGDVIAVRTGLGRMFIGTLLLAGATSLPELLTNISAVQLGEPNLAAGNIFGSSMFNMLLLGIVGLVPRRIRVLRVVALRHAFSASLAVMLSGLTVFFLLADIPLQVGWMGIDSLLIIAAYVAGVRLIRQNAAPDTDEEAEVPGAGVPSLRRGIIGFILAAVVLGVVTPQLVKSSETIAVITGLGASFVGTALLGVVTSLPEVVTTLAAVRIRAYDMAVGNLFGSNIFNLFALGISDAFFTQGRLLGSLDPLMAQVAMLGVLLTCLGLLSNMARPEPQRWVRVDFYALGIILGYVAALVWVYRQGLGL